ncbi:MAG: transpeptidase family protein [Bacteroidales bacterium]|nr:transpeptidase family protein [Bacteroidales bacterium]
MEENKNKTGKKRDRIGLILYFFYGLALIASVIIIGQIVCIQLFFKVDENLIYLFHPSNTRSIIEPARGSIISNDGRLLAMSTPMYQIYMDCAVQKAEYAADGDKGKEKELEWRGKVHGLADSLAAMYGDKSASEYYDLIISSRENGRRNVKIGSEIDHGRLQRVKQFPLFKEGANRGGIIVNKHDTRQYPYGSLARRTIGYVKDNEKSNGNNLIGIEGSYDAKLHGQEGYEYLKTTDGRKKIHNYDSTFVKAEDGYNVRTTIDIDIQDIADRALRRQIADDPDIEGGCLVVMDVKTGAIRAMVNLRRDTTTVGHPVNESYNWAIGRAGEPGSVFKSVTLMTLLEDGYVKSIEETLPINHGNYKKYPHDDHIADFGRENKTDVISVKDALKISSNQAFCYLAVENYQDNPKAFMDKIFMYKLGEAFKFDIDGLKTPSVKTPDSQTWSGTDLGVTAYGYGITETPLHILTFYNAIANKGKMMKPYLVESVEKDGKIIEKVGPSILNASICSRSTADTLTRALRAVVEEGTGKTQLGKAKLPVAGKTGTARVVLDGSIALPGNPYFDKFGRKQNQGTFVGFFPYDDPQYSIIAVVYSTVSFKAFYGGTKPAAAVNETINGMYGLKQLWGESLLSKGTLARMEADNSRITKSEDGATKATVPDVTGLGLKDAIYTIENSGFKCSFSGVGHVSKQSPSSGSTATKGGTITITLK